VNQACGSLKIVPAKAAVTVQVGFKRLEEPHGFLRTAFHEVAGQDLARDGEVMIAYAMNSEQTDAGEWISAAAGGAGQSAEDVQ
jgi:hypothetical protein